jgi:hypothetical protein
VGSLDGCGEVVGADVLQQVAGRAGFQRLLDQVLFMEAGQDDDADKVQSEEGACNGHKDRKRFGKGRF